MAAEYVRDDRLYRRLGIAISHYRFRRGYVAQGLNLADLLTAPALPWVRCFAFALCLIITLGQNYQAFLADRIDWYGVAATYRHSAVPVIWLGYKLTRGTRFVKYSEMEFPSLSSNA